MRSMRTANSIGLGALCAILGCLPFAALAAEVESDVAERVDDLTRLEIEAQPINDFITKVDGQGAIFVINTSEGSVKSAILHGVSIVGAAHLVEVNRDLAPSAFGSSLETHMLQKV